MEKPNILASISEVLPKLASHMEVNSNSEPQCPRFARSTCHCRFESPANKNNPLEKLTNESTSIEELINNAISLKSKYKSSTNAIFDSLKSTIQ